MTAPVPNEWPGNLPNDHPGSKEPVQNPNPRANENLPATGEPVPEEPGSVEEVGEEITDGEDG